MTFHEKACTPCQGGIPPLTATESGDLLRRVPAWTLAGDGTRLARSFDFPDYRRALAFVNAVSAIAETEGHHPDLCFGWGYVRISLQTHAINGLHENDFLLAAKIDRIPAPNHRPPAA